MSLDFVRLGLVGAGRWGRNFIPTIAGLSRIRLTRLASRNPASHELIGPGCALHPDWRHMLDAGGLDGVIVATPPASHSEIAIAALDRGFAVLVEKPVTLDLSQAQTLRDRARAVRGIAQVDHIALVSPAWQALRQHVPEVGTIRRMRGAWVGWGPFRQDTSAGWDYGPHPLALCIDLVGAEPDSVNARYLAREDGGELLDVSLDWNEGMAATLRYGNAARVSERNLTVEGEAGFLRYDDLAADQALLNGVPVPFSPQAPLAAVVERFASAIRRGAADTADMDLGVSVVRTLTRMDATLGAERT